MKTKFVAASLPVAVSGTLVLMTGCSSPRLLTAQEANYPVEQIDAHDLFIENCATCHGQNGRGHTFHGWIVGAQNFTDLSWQVGTTDKQVIDAIQTGPGVMPAFEKKLSPTEIQALAKYVRTFRQTE